jgi:peptidoglycan/xylan/chitin deacetylase (PgdA/CDA1 family)
VLVSLAPSPNQSGRREYPGTTPPSSSKRDLAKASLCGLYRVSGAMAVQERLAYWAGRRFVAVLLFHRVTDGIPQDGLTVGTEWFRRLCVLLRDRFHVVSLGEMVRLLQAPAGPPRRTVAITFDDCYRDNLHAARMLADHALPACFFVPTHYVGTDHIFEWDRGLKPMANLDWDDVRALVRMGHEVGSHSLSHADFGAISADVARRELAESRKMLENRLECPARWFAYPFGGRDNFRSEYLPLVYDAGYAGCFSGFGGCVRPGMLGQILPREPMPQFRSLLNLELHLSGCLEWFYSLKRKMGFASPCGG